MSNRQGWHATDHVWTAFAGNRSFSLRRSGDYTGLVPTMRTGNGKGETGRVMTANDIADLIAILARELKFIANGGTDRRATDTEDQG